MYNMSRSQQKSKNSVRDNGILVVLKAIILYVPEGVPFPRNVKSWPSGRSHTGRCPSPAYPSS